MRVTKAELEVYNAHLRSENLSLLGRMAVMERDNKQLEQRLASLTQFVSNFAELPRAVHGATEALAHMLTDARQMYLPNHRQDLKR